MGEHIPVERVEFGVVDIGFQNTFGEIVEHDVFRGSTEAAEGGFVQFRPDLTAGLEAQQTDAFAAEAERQHEEAGATVFASFRITDLRAGAVVDLQFFARGGEDDGAGFRSLRAALLADEAFDGFVGAGEAVTVDHFLPDRHGVAAGHESLLDEVAVGFARAVGGCGVGGHRIGRFWHLFGVFGLGIDAGVGGHRIGRFWRGAFAPGAGRAQGDAGGLEIGPCGFSPDSGLLLDTAQ